MIAARVKYQAMRDFADAQDPPISYRTAAGKYSYTADLVRRFEDHIAGTTGQG
jgi:hypothetical protein